MRRPEETLAPGLPCATPAGISGSPTAPSGAGSQAGSEPPPRLLPSQPPCPGQGWREAAEPPRRRGKVAFCSAVLSRAGRPPRRFPALAAEITSSCLDTLQILGSRRRGVKKHHRAKKLLRTNVGDRGRARTVLRRQLSYFLWNRESTLQTDGLKKE